MNHILLPVMALVAVVLLWPSGAPPTAGAGRAAPDFPTRDPKMWIHSSPLSVADLRGRVVLIDVWTYG